MSADRGEGPLLEVENLHVQFATSSGTAEVINGVDLTIEEGETVALVGETGCGKSVTVKSILGLLSQPPAKIPKGSIKFRGQELLGLPDEEMRQYRGQQISMILQNPMTALNPIFTVGEQMLDVLRWQGERRVGVTKYVRSKFSDNSEHRERALDMLDRVNIPAPERVFESYPVELSGGMRQRVLIAIALLSEPELLIADEPGTALDVTTEDKILSLLNEMIEETDASVLYITHDLGVARQVSQEINVMYAGEIVEHGPTSELFEAPKHPYTRGLLDSIPQLSRDIGSGIPGEIPDYTAPPTGCRFAPRCSHAEPECTEVHPFQRSVGPDRSVGCHLYEGAPVFERHSELAREDVYIGPPPWDEETTDESVRTMMPEEGEDQ
ncbi:ABC transporter ATP-binding protein [Halorarius halobius]|uniref:ABC transporter ATP-binding protein n=1 Tax=Halorarius halobius TaxID=2962671 RepID=UPI0020CCA9FF|nr:ABC transporter ATP-binding protein [Halorarius halobius]